MAAWTGLRAGRRLATPNCHHVGQMQQAWQSPMSTAGCMLCTFVSSLKRSDASGMGTFQIRARPGRAREHQVPLVCPWPQPGLCCFRVPQRLTHVNQSECNLIGGYPQARQVCFEGLHPIIRRKPSTSPCFRAVLSHAIPKKVCLMHAQYRTLRIFRFGFSKYLSVPESSSMTDLTSESRGGVMDTERSGEHWQRDRLLEM